MPQNERLGYYAYCMQCSREGREALEFVVWREEMAAYRATIIADEGQANVQWATQNPSAPTEQQMTPEYQAYINGSTPFSAITIREWLAGLSLQGLLSNPQWADCLMGELDKCAVDHADALLLELQKEPQR